MAGSRTLKLSILADVDDLKKNLTAGSKDVETFGDQVTKFGKVAAAAFVAAAAAAGAYALKIGVDGVKAAIEDEKAQTQLALALKNATGATTAQIAATEDSILQMSLATGVADDKLRPALQKLALNTNDLGKAQELLSVALNVSTATGKPLEQVATAIGVAYDGNTAALAKLKIGLTATELKSMTFTEVQAKLNEQFGGAAQANAETYAGRIARMQVAFNEAKETIGYALLPILEKAMRFINDYATPVIEAFSKGIGDKSGLGLYFNNLATLLKNVFLPIWEGLVYAFDKIKTAIEDNKEGFMAFAKIIQDYVAPVLGTVLGSALKTIGDIAGGVLSVIGKVAGFIADVVETAVAGINILIRAYNSIPLLPNIPTIPVSSVPQVTVPKVTSSGASTYTAPTIPTPSSAGTSSAVSSASSAAAAANNGGFVNQPGQAATYAANQAMVDAVIAAAESKANVTVNIGVAGDPEGVARTVVDVLQQQYYRGTYGTAVLDL